MNVNCVAVGLDLTLEECWCKRLTFSWPGADGSFSALAMALDMMPGFSPWEMTVSGGFLIYSVPPFQCKKEDKRRRVTL